MNYYIQIPSPNKAKDDVDVLFAKMGYANLSLASACHHPVWRFVTRLIAIARILTHVGKGDVLCLQYPMKKFYVIACRLTHLKGGRVITIIHDLGAFRRKKLTIGEENRKLENTDFLIVHNEKMKQHLQDNGCRVPIFCLDIFDFLTEATPRPAQPLHHPCRVVFAGKLARWRNEFLYHLEEIASNWTLDVYGDGFAIDTTEKSHVHPRGSLTPNEFVNNVEADFGLVWDGSSLDECDGEWGRYLLINNPHKTSFYLRAGIPVIVWDKAAMAPFVQQEGIGICIQSIRKLNSVLASITDDQYARLRANAMAFSEKLGSGYYTQRAFNEGMKVLNVKD